MKLPGTKKYIGRTRQQYHDRVTQVNQQIADISKIGQLTPNNLDERKVFLPAEALC